jgi:hypothetical protein
MLVEQIGNAKVCRVAIVPRGRDKQRRILSAFWVPERTQGLPNI